MSDKSVDAPLNGRPLRWSKSEGRRFDGVINPHVSEFVDGTGLVVHRTDVAKDNPGLSVKPEGVIHTPDPHGEMSWPHMPLAVGRSSIDSPTASSGNFVEAGIIKFEST